MKLFTICASLIALASSHLAVGGDVARGGECCGCPPQKIVYHCCREKKCCDREKPAPREPRAAYAPYGPIVESVPVLANPVLLAQDRMVLSATQLRDARTYVGVRIAAQESSRGFEARSARSCEERLDEVEVNLNKLHALVEKQQLMLQQISDQVNQLKK